MPTNKTLSPRGLSFIKEFEGFREKAYVCPGGKLTIGYGHVIHAHEPHLKTATLTEEEASLLLLADLSRFEATVRDSVKVPLSQGQYDALVSFAFNVGTSALRNSTLLRLLNAGQYQAAADQFPRWVFSAGKRLPGLVRRRNAERAMFLS